MSKATRQQGLTLIELLIVLGILAILAVVAFRVHNERSIRAKVDEGFSLAETAKTAVEKAFRSTTTWPTDNTAAGLPAVINGIYVETVTVANGVITVTFGSLEAALAGKSILFTPYDKGTTFKWSCHSADLSIFYRPDSCQSKIVEGSG